MNDMIICFEFRLYREKLGNEYFLHEEIKISFLFITMYFVVSILAHWRLTTQQNPQLLYKCYGPTHNVNTQ